MLSGKVSVVTGGGGMLGRSISLALAAAGSDIALIDVRAEAMAPVAAEVETLGRRAIHAVCDVRSKEAVTAAFRQVADRLGGVDILVNTAGGTLDTAGRPLAEVEVEQWDVVVDVNLKGTFLCCQAAVRYMQQRGGGRIINVSSMAGRAPAHLAPVQYSAAKAGVVGLTRHLAKELGGGNINVNAIAPGLIAGTRSDTLFAARSERERQQALSAGALARMSTTEEQADIVVFLAGRASRYLTGLVIDSNGGRYMG